MWFSVSTLGQYNCSCSAPAVADHVHRLADLTLSGRRAPVVFTQRRQLGRLHALQKAELACTLREQFLSAERVPEQVAVRVVAVVEVRHPLCAVRRHAGGVDVEHHLLRRPDIGANDVLAFRAYRRAKPPRGHACLKADTPPHVRGCLVMLPVSA